MLKSGFLRGSIEEKQPADQTTRPRRDQPATDIPCSDVAVKLLQHFSKYFKIHTSLIIFNIPTQLLPIYRTSWYKITIGILKQ